MKTAQLLRSALTAAVAFSGLAVTATAFPNSASAAGTPNLSPIVIVPAATPVNTNGQYSVQVVNNGSAPTSAPWTVTVRIPKTNRIYSTSYLYNAPRTRLVKGKVSLPPGSPCVVSNLDLLCTMASPLSDQVGSNTVNIGFQMELPYSWGAYQFSAETNDGLGGLAASPVAVAGQTTQAVTAPLGQITVDYCSGAGLDGTQADPITSFWECAPAGSVNSSPYKFGKMTLSPGGVLTNFFAGNNQPIGRTGTWSINGSQLNLTVRSGTGVQIGTWAMQGVSANCWEGPLGAYSGGVGTAPYRACL